jgi:L-lactate dehydrogenase complex protein LldG
LLGTLVLVSGVEQRRLISLTPPVHIRVRDPARITAGAPDMMSMLREQFYSGDTGKPQATTFITGPSRTADIEHIVTLGVRGPRVGHILLLQFV